jgi:aspartyl-tRNA(Asn)/glutamyl-tRNA(Gln) amidotransferase subunit A
LLAEVFAPNRPSPTRRFSRFAVIDESYLHDCEPEIVTALHSVAGELEALGLQSAKVDVSWWAGAFEIFAPIQAWEAARIHEGNFEKIAPAIRERLEWGARITTAEIESLRARHAEFRSRIDELLEQHELLLLPATPVTKLAVGADHSQTRGRLLRYTTAFSLAGVPVVTIPGTSGGMQLAAARESDEELLQLAAELGAARKRPS